MELYADATGCTVAQAAEDDAVLLGTAMSAATAAGFFPDLATAAAAMARPGPVTHPNSATRASYDRDYRIFLTMHDQRRALDRIG
jgi:ribulose kinase